MEGKRWVIVLQNMLTASLHFVFEEQRDAGNIVKDLAALQQYFIASV